jgi:hypothetical protein
MSNKEHLEYIYRRMSKVHGDYKNFNYMLRFKKIIEEYKTPKKLDMDINPAFTQELQDVLSDIFNNRDNIDYTTLKYLKSIASNKSLKIRIKQ